ncbi:hypothetical protein [Methanocella sp. MCL-LM]|uniref:hypothetical protein n=1 Tax=Methanocella sp. MCL-LM TaxID=3412035 RepID=UPI003C795AB3
MTTSIYFIPFDWFAWLALITFILIGYYFVRYGSNGYMLSIIAASVLSWLLTGMLWAQMVQDYINGLFVALENPVLAYLGTIISLIVTGIAFYEIYREVVADGGVIDKITERFNL